MSAIQAADRPGVAEPGQPNEQQPDPFAIATFLRQHNTHPDMSVTVWRHGCICILLEGDAVPPQAAATTWLKRSLSQFSELKTVRVYARQIGQNLPIWHDNLNLSQSAIAVSQPSSLLNWLHQGDRGSAPPATPAVDLEVTTQQTRFLRFYLTEQETALLALESIQEVLRVSVDNILPVPGTADSVLGVYDHRGEILWLVNLSQPLGFPEADGQFTTILTVIVIKQDGVSLGAVVRRVTDIEMHDLQHLQPVSADLFSLPLRSFLQGYFLQPTSFVLDAQALISHITSSPAVTP
ncbi:MAG: chemotaxis protein CheW [Oculatellaceae cyanobacterium bins.114]|nr:chemotaxis protein CheW [Oculatellaceae cyanobacterium bins.114]